MEAPLGAVTANAGSGRRRGAGGSCRNILESG